MIVDMLSESVGQFGYFALFFMLWLGIVGMPIPDEVIVLSAGVLTSMGILHVFPAFIATYLGVVSGLSLGYVLGRWLGAPALNWISRKKGMNKYVDQAQSLLDRYGSYALCISYFFPVVRHVVPYLVGIGKMTFPRYALFSYTTGFVWTLILFLLGHFMGNKVEMLTSYVALLNNRTVIFSVLGVLVLLAAAYYGFTVWRKQKSMATAPQPLMIERDRKE